MSGKLEPSRSIAYGLKCDTCTGCGRKFSSRDLADRHITSAPNCKPFVADPLEKSAMDAHNHLARLWAENDARLS